MLYLCKMSNVVIIGFKYGTLIKYKGWCMQVPLPPSHRWIEDYKNDFINSVNNNKYKKQ